ncbi:hypothetical protein ACHQM5_022867 [Ranunculus cassubicifolius]
MPQKNPFTWHSLIEAYLKSGNKDISLKLFNAMLISNFAKSGDLRDARLLFDEMPVRNGVVMNAMIHGYACNGEWRGAFGLYADLNINHCESSKTAMFIFGVCAQGLC